jgi:hypothetical protein
MDQTDLLFPSPEVDGQPLSYNTVFGVYKRCLAFLELPPVTLHSLRHTFASTMLAAGAPITTLARNLGRAPQTSRCGYTVTKSSKDSARAWSAPKSCSAAPDSRRKETSSRLERKKTSQIRRLHFTRRVMLWWLF